MYICTYVYVYPFSYIFTGILVYFNPYSDCPDLSFDFLEIVNIILSFLVRPSCLSCLFYKMRKLFFKYEYFTFLKKYVPEEFTHVTSFPYAIIIKVWKTIIIKTTLTGRNQTNEQGDSK